MYGWLMTIISWHETLGMSYQSANNCLITWCQILGVGTTRVARPVVGWCLFKISLSCVQHVLAAGGGVSGGLLGWLVARALPTGWSAIRKLLMLVCSSWLPDTLVQRIVPRWLWQMLTSMSTRKLLIPHLRGSINRRVLFSLLATWNSHSRNGFVFWQHGAQAA